MSIDNLTHRFTSIINSRPDERTYKSQITNALIKEDIEYVWRVRAGGTASVLYINPNDISRACKLLISIKFPRTSKML